MAGEIPAGNHHQAQQDAGPDGAGIGAEFLVAEHESQQSPADDRGGDAGRGRCCKTGQCVEHGRQAGLAQPGQVDGHRVEKGDTPLCEQSLEGHVGGDGQEHQHHQRAHTASAQAHQILVRATARQGHADTKHRAAQQQG